MRDNYDNLIGGRPDLVQQTREVAGVVKADKDQLTFNPIFGAIMARIWLYRRPGALPPAHDVPAMAVYAKANYNITGGAIPESYVIAYHHLVLAA